jgi:thioredoxin-dependent peroxiredoxin
MLKVGDAAPLFELPDASMEMFDLGQYIGRKHVVLFFYPKDDTPMCTLEAIDFSDMEEEFARFDTVVVGVSRDDCISHAAFRDKHGLSASLLADTDGDVAEKYGVLQEKIVDGTVRKTVARTTFVIDKQGIVRHAETVVSPRGHAHEILRRVKEFTRNAN